VDKVLGTESSVSRVSRVYEELSVLHIEERLDTWNC